MLKSSLKILHIISATIILVYLILTGMEKVSAQTWTGDVSNSWHEAGNWDPQTVPVANSTVTIPSVSPKPFPVIAQSTTIKTINLSDWSDGELTVTNNATLTVTGSLNIKESGKLFLNNGTLQFDGSSFVMHNSGTLIQITENGSFISSSSLILAPGEISVTDGNIDFRNGFTLHSNGTLNVTNGNINVFGSTNINGTINGGTGNFDFDGNSSDNVAISGEGRFYMSPSALGNHPLNCPSGTPGDPEISVGTVNFRTTCKIQSSGYFHGGNADVTFHKSPVLSGTSYVETHNGTLRFLENLTCSSTAYVNITCNGTLKVDGNTTLRSAGFINAGSGIVYFGGNLKTENSSGTINAENSTIYFSGDSFVNEGNFNAGTSTFYFNGNGNQSLSTHHWRDANTFYNLIVEDGSNVLSYQNVLVLNNMNVDDDAEFEIADDKTLNVVGDVKGESFITTSRPYIVSIRINAPNSITAVFNESLHKGNANNKNNYEVENEAKTKKAELGGANDNEVTITLGFSMVKNKNYYLIVNKIKNSAGNVISTDHRKRFGLSEAENTWEWAGTIDPDWDTPGNWVKNNLPPADAVVIVPVTPNDPVISSQNNTISELEIATGASLTIGTTGNLTVSNTITNEAGNSGLVIDSGTDGTGSLIHHNNGVPATFRRYISGEPQAWQMISSPISNQAIAGNFTPTGGDAYGDNTRYDFYTWHEPDTSWVYLLNDNQPPTWNTANGSNNFIPARGYLVSYKDEHPTKTFTGDLNNGQIAVSVTKTAGVASEFGHNLLGNPYPSSIDWKAATGWNRNNLVSTGGGYEIWIWSETNQNYGAYNSSSSSDEGTLGVSRYIAPNQGFFVKAQQSGSISMDNAVRVHNGSGNWLKNATAPTLNENVKLTVASSEGLGSDEAIVEFGHPKTAAGARKKFSFVPSAPSLFIPGDEKLYSIRQVGEKENNAVLPVSFKAGETGSYKLTAEIGFEAFEFLELFDKITGIRHNLKEEPTYHFQANPADRTDRFILQVVPGNFADPHNSLPVNMFTRQKVLHVDMRLLNGPFYCDVYTISGQQVAKKLLFGGDISQISLPVSSSMIIVHISGSEGKMYKKIPVF